MKKIFFISILIAGISLEVCTLQAQTPEFLVDENTYIEVCFWAEHTYVSDLGFYLKAPGHEFSEPGDTGVVRLCPAASDWGPNSQFGSCIGIPWSILGCEPEDENTVCNSGNNVGDETKGFCFQTHDSPGGSVVEAGTPELTPCVCNMATPLIGTFASVGSWETVYGFNINEEDWTVQIYDCELADEGNVIRATIHFVKFSECDSVDILYEFDNMNLPINDGSCSATSASLYTLPLIYSDIQYFEEEVPLICGVSINENNNSEIFWNYFSSEIVDSVIVFEVNTLTSERFRIGAVKFSETSFFLDTLTLPQQEELAYCIGFKNICGNVNLVSTIQKSIFLSSSYSNNIITLEWNENESFSEDSVSIYRGNNLDNLQLIERVLYSDLIYNDNYETENDSLFYKLCLETHLCDQEKEIITINSNISDIYTSNFVEVNPIRKNDEIIIVPNPANDIINIDVNNLKAKITITDLQGKILLTKENFKGGDIFVGNLHQGTYFVKIETEEIKTVRKLIIE